MHFTSVAFFLASAHMAAAVPSPSIISMPTFHLEATYPNPEFPYKQFIKDVAANLRHLLINEKFQEAHCASPTEVATFYIDSGSLFLYADNSQPKQQVYVGPKQILNVGTYKDEGRALGFLTIGQGQDPPEGSYLTGWSLADDGELFFDRGNNFTACPDQRDGSWSLYLTEKDAQHCLSFTPKVTLETNPVSCHYVG